MSELACTPSRGHPELGGPLLRRADRDRQRQGQPGHRRRGPHATSTSSPASSPTCSATTSPEVREAVERQLATGVVHTSTLYLIRGQVELAEKIARLSGIDDAKVFFTNSGTEANETALLLAHVPRARATRSSPCAELPRPVVRRRSGVTGNRAWKTVGPQPARACTTCTARDRQLPQFRGPRDADYIEACVDGPARTCWPPDHGRRRGRADRRADPGRRRLHACRRTGCSRRTRRSSTSTASCSSPTRCRPAGAGPASTSGASRRHGVTPDMMTFAKGLGNGFAIGGVVGPRRPDGRRCTAIGISTFGGNPISTAAGNATLDYVLDHDLQAQRRRHRRDLIIDGLREAARAARRSSARCAARA